MNQENTLLANYNYKVVDYLRNCLPSTTTLRIVSAYFTIYGYETLEKELSKVGDVRFLFGDPDSVGEMDPNIQGSKSFSLINERLSPKHQLRQKPLAVQCAEWVEKIQIRSINKSNFLHGKMYLTESVNNSSSIVGSSNFTKSGLGGSDNSNLEINLATKNPKACEEMQLWFDILWEDSNITEDVKEKVLAALKRVGKECDPMLIYFKSLYEIFRDEIEFRQIGDKRLEDIQLYDTQIWQALFDFQREGVRGVIARLTQYNGCILADSVGLGKTYTALAVIKYFELSAENVLVLCPKNLRENWSQYLVTSYRENNPFSKDQFRYALLSHTDLSRYSGKVGDINLETFPWQNFDLIVIDESHNFRNDTKPVYHDDGSIAQHSRYSRLLEEVLVNGVNTKVLMLSATPVNTSLIDLRNQIYLMTEKRNDDFEKSLGISNVGALLSQAQKQFKDWENNLPISGEKNKTELLEKLSPEFFRLLGGISIARSRRQIKLFFREDTKKIGDFPQHQKLENFYPSADLKEKLSYTELATQIDKFSLSIYRPSSYVTSKRAIKQLEEEKKKRHFNQLNREDALIGMIRTNFLKRLESSAYSLTKTLERTVSKIDTQIEKINLYESTRQMDDENSHLSLKEFEDDDEFVINQARQPYKFEDLDLLQWKTDLLNDKETLVQVLNQVNTITPERDGKLDLIKKHVTAKVNMPSRNLEGNLNRKLLIFTAFKDTAEYLYDNLKELGDELNINLAMVSGVVTHTNFGENKFDVILSNFAPRARNRMFNIDGEIDILVATDCISEGQNLQDCDTVLNYDIHWNPVRIIQRFGRIDRIGSINGSVRMLNFWPTKEMEAYLNLESRVKARMALVDTTATGDADPLDESYDQQVYDCAQLELSFRDKQLTKLREENLELGDESDTIEMSDFTLDYFYSQLLRYLETNKDELEATPTGAYAITKSVNESSVPGVIFVLRQRKITTDKLTRHASPIYPFYVVFVQYNGNIRYGCMNTKQVLDLFESTANDVNKVHQELCDLFNYRTQNGKQMELYEDLLNKVVEHICHKNKLVQIKQMGKDGEASSKIPRISESARRLEDFELVTWLIVGLD